MSEKPVDEGAGHPPFNELASARVGRRLRRAREFREQVLSRSPDAIIEPSEAASIFGYTAEELEAALDSGELPSSTVDGRRVIHVADLKAGLAARSERLERFTRGLAELRNELDLDD